MHELTDNKKSRYAYSESNNAFVLPVVQGHQKRRDHKESLNTQNIAYVICNKFIIHFSSPESSVGKDIVYILIHTLCGGDNYYSIACHDVIVTARDNNFSHAVYAGKKDIVLEVDFF